MIAPLGLSVGQTILAAPGADIVVGNCLPLRSIPVGTTVHNIELRPARAASSREAPGPGPDPGQGRKVRPPAPPFGEVRLVLTECRATIGQVGNIDYANVSVGKAGRSRWLGKRPMVRGVAMNPVDHPHGGGEGRLGRSAPGDALGQFRRRGTRPATARGRIAS